MKHSIEEIKLKSGARGILIDAPGSGVMNIRVVFRAGNKFVKKPEIYEVAHLMEHMAFGRNAERCVFCKEKPSKNILVTIDK